MIDRMVLSVPEYRPAFLKREDAGVFHELRGFRHVFRNIYQSRLEPDRVEAINEKVPLAVELMKSSHGAFIEKEDQELFGLWKDHEEVNVEDYVRNMREGCLFNN